LLHFAYSQLIKGDVIYQVDGFLNKNRDTLFTDLIQAMQTSKNETVLQLFPDDLADNKKRPVTAGTYSFFTHLYFKID